MLSTIANLAWKSILARKTTAFLTIIAIALSVALYTSIEMTRSSARTSFESTVSGVDAIVGGRTAPINLLLFSVFHMGSPTAPISWETFEQITERSDVAWTVPISLGDNHKGYTVLGTEPSYFEHYKYGAKRPLSYKQGSAFNPHKLDVVLGSKVAKTLDYSIGDRISLSHGVQGVSFMHHDAFQFTIVGILAPTGTPVDSTLHISLEAMTRIHEPAEMAPIGLKREADSSVTSDHDNHAHNDDQEHDHNEDEEHDHEEHDHDAQGHEEQDHDAHGHDEHHDHVHAEPGTITAILVGLKSRGNILNFNRSVNTYSEEALLSIGPAMTLSSLWSIMGTMESVLNAIAIFVIFVGLSTILVSILTSLNERRREMAVLRSIGAKPRHLGILIVSEASILSFFGAVFGVCISYVLLNFATPWINSNFGLALTQTYPGYKDILVIFIVTALSSVMALWPALIAMQKALADGLTIKY